MNTFEIGIVDGKAVLRTASTRHPHIMSFPEQKKFKGEDLKFKGFELKEEIKIHEF